MANTLIIYSSTDGHTKTICRRLTNFLKHDDEIKIISLEEVKKFDLSEFSKIILGASIRYGKHSTELYKFIDRIKDANNEGEARIFSMGSTFGGTGASSIPVMPVAITDSAKIITGGKVDLSNLNYGRIKIFKISRH